MSSSNDNATRNHSKVLPNQSLATTALPTHDAPARGKNNMDIQITNSDNNRRIKNGRHNGRQKFSPPFSTNLSGQPSQPRRVSPLRINKTDATQSSSIGRPTISPSFSANSAGQPAPRQRASPPRINRAGPSEHNNSVIPSTFSPSFSFNLAGESLPPSIHQNDAYTNSSNGRPNSFSSSFTAANPHIQVTTPLYNSQFNQRQQMLQQQQQQLEAQHQHQLQCSQLYSKSGTPIRSQSAHVSNFHPSASLPQQQQQHLVSTHQTQKNRTQSLQLPHGQHEQQRKEHPSRLPHRKPQQYSNPRASDPTQEQQYKQTPTNTPGTSQNQQQLSMSSADTDIRQEEPSQKRPEQPQTKKVHPSRKSHVSVSQTRSRSAHVSNFPPDSMHQHQQQQQYLGSTHPTQKKVRAQSLQIPLGQRQHEQHREEHPSRFPEGQPRPNSKPRSRALNPSREQPYEQTPTITLGTSLSTVIQTAEMDKGWIQQQEHRRQRTSTSGAVTNTRREEPSQKRLEPRLKKDSSRTPHGQPRQYSKPGTPDPIQDQQHTQTPAVIQKQQQKQRPMPTSSAVTNNQPGEPSKKRLDQQLKDQLRKDHPSRMTRGQSRPKSKPRGSDRTKEQQGQQSPTITPGTSLSSVIQTAEMDKGWIQQQQQQKQQALHVDVKPSRSRSAHVSNQQYLDSTHPTHKSRAQSLQVPLGQHDQHLNDHPSRTHHGQSRPNSKPRGSDQTKEQRCKQTPTITPGTSLSSVIQTVEIDKGWIQQQQQQKQRQRSSAATNNRSEEPSNLRTAISPKSPNQTPEQPGQSTPTLLSGTFLSTAIQEEHQKRQSRPFTTTTTTNLPFTPSPPSTTTTPVPKTPAARPPNKHELQRHSSYINLSLDGLTKLGGGTKKKASAFLDRCRDSFYSQATNVTNVTNQSNFTNKSVISEVSARSDGTSESCLMVEFGARKRRPKQNHVYYGSGSNSKLDKVEKGSKGSMPTSKHYPEANEAFPSVGNIPSEDQHAVSSTKKEPFVANSTHPTNSNANNSTGIQSLTAQVESNANIKSSQPIEGTALNMNSLLDAELPKQKQSDIAEIDEDDISWVQSSDSDSETDEPAVQPPVPDVMHADFFRPDGSFNNSVSKLLGAGHLTEQSSLSFKKTRNVKHRPMLSTIPSQSSQYIDKHEATNSGMLHSIDSYISATSSTNSVLEKSTSKGFVNGRPSLATAFTKTVEETAEPEYPHDHRGMMEQNSIIIDSIMDFIRHVPSCVVDTLFSTPTGSFVEEWTSSAVPNKMDEAALLFVDISGFTKLATRLDVESLSSVLNSYFDLLVKHISAHGGDVLKFAGDAVFANWPLGRNNIKTMEQSVVLAAKCGASIVATCSNFAVEVRNRGGSSRDVTERDVLYLDVHCGLGVGKLIGFHAGIDTSSESNHGGNADGSVGSVSNASPGNSNTSSRSLNASSSFCEGANGANPPNANTANKSTTMSLSQRDLFAKNSVCTRMEFLICGEPIDQVAHAEAMATSGQLVASVECISILLHARALPDSFHGIVVQNRLFDSHKTASMSNINTPYEHPPPQNNTPTSLNGSVSLPVPAPPKAAIIATSTNNYLRSDHNVTLEDCVGDAYFVEEQRLGMRLEMFSSHKLRRIYDTLCLYVHPVVRDMEKTVMDARLVAQLQRQRRQSSDVAVPSSVTSASQRSFNSAYTLQRRNASQTSVNSRDTTMSEPLPQKRSRTPTLDASNSARSFHSSGPMPSQSGFYSSSQHTLTSHSSGPMPSQRSFFSSSQPTCPQSSAQWSDNRKQRRVAEAELRNVYTIFITPVISSQLHFSSRVEDVQHNSRLLQRLNDIMVVTTRELDNFGGHLRQYIVDDKGVVLIASFGLPGSTFPHMVSERALPATLAIQSSLDMELNVETRIGAAFGKVYCGVVGGIHRHEFSILGPSVNLAARLMGNAANEGILVDDAVRRQATRFFEFKSYAPVRAKGYPDPVPIFEPLTVIERQWKKPRGFVGRKKEMNLILNMARSCIVGAKKPTNMILVTGESGVGKSSMVYEAIQKVRRLDMKGRTRSSRQTQILIAKGVCEEIEAKVPYSVMRSLFMQVALDGENAFGLLEGENRNGSSSGGQTADFDNGDYSTINSGNSTLRKASTLSSGSNCGEERRCFRRRLSMASSVGRLQRGQRRRFSLPNSKSSSEIILEGDNVTAEVVSNSDGSASSTPNGNHQPTPATPNDNATIDSRVSSSGPQAFSLSDRQNTFSTFDNHTVSETGSLASDDNSTVDTDGLEPVLLSLDRFRSLCRLFNRDEDFALVVGISILNLENEGSPTPAVDMSKLKRPRTADVVEFMVDVILRHTLGHKLLLLAIDDAQWMDSFSWKVVRGLFEKGFKVLLICISRPFQDYQLKVDPNFWERLQTESEVAFSRVQKISLSSLEPSDMANLISRSLKRNVEDISPHVVSKIYEQCGGMPYFALELLEETKRNQMVTTIPHPHKHSSHTEGLVVWATDARGKPVTFHKSAVSSLNGLLLRRVDAMGPDARTVLQLCAVLGLEFYLWDLLILYEGMLDGMEDQHRDNLGGHGSTDNGCECVFAEEFQRSILRTLEDAVNEKILVEVCTGTLGGEGQNNASNGDSDDGDGDRSEAVTTLSELDSERSYRFTHSTWRASILDALLDERKRDIHKTIAEAVEKDNDWREWDDPASLLNLLDHWKACNETERAGEVALVLIRCFDDLGLLQESLGLMEDMLNSTWASPSSHNDGGDGSTISLPTTGLVASAGNGGTAGCSNGDDGDLSVAISAADYSTDDTRNYHPNKKTLNFGSGGGLGGGSYCQNDALSLAGYSTDEARNITGSSTTLPKKRNFPRRRRGSTNQTIPDTASAPDTKTDLPDCSRTIELKNNFNRIQNHLQI